MTTAFGTSMANLANSLLAKFAIPTTYKVRPRSSAGSQTGSVTSYSWPSTPPTTSADFSAQISPTGATQAGAARRRVIYTNADGITFTPIKGMKVEQDTAEGGSTRTETYTVSKVNRFAGDERVAAYELELEG